MFGLVYISLAWGRGYPKPKLEHACMHASKRLPGVQAMQSEGLPTGRQALFVLGWSCEQA